MALEISDDLMIDYSRRHSDLHYISGVLTDWLRIALVLVLAVATKIWHMEPVIAAKPWACTEATGKIVNTSVHGMTYQFPVSVSVYLPPCYNALTTSIPVVYLLHGANANETQWPDLRIQRSADSIIAETHLPFVVVMPGGNYFYKLDYSTFVLNDLMPAIEGTYGAQAAGCGRAIGGLSLGGYWALKIAFQHPNLFVAAGGHSPVVSGMGADAPLALARTAKGLNRLSITLDVGKSDGLKSGTLQLVEVLKSRSIPVTLALNAGGHDRHYWRMHSAEYLRFYAKRFNALICQSNQP